MPKTMTPKDFLEALGKATEGLLFPSESDYPLTPYRWVGAEDTGPSPEALVRSEGKPADTKVETESVHDMFDPLTQEQPTWNDEDRAEAARYKAVVKLLEEQLSHLRVYRVGKVDLHVYVLGQHASGEWLGLKTHVVET